MNIVDIAVCILLVLAFVSGYRRGLIRQLVSVLGVIVALFLAYKLYDDAAPLLRGLLPLETFAAYPGYGFVLNNTRIEEYAVNGLAFVLLFAVVKIALSVAGHLLHWIAEAPGLNAVNRWSGAILAMLEAVLLFVLVVYVMSVWPSDAVQASLEGSTAAKLAADVAPVWFEKLSELWSGL
ncbi:CvpA family protein [Paenibacillus sp. MBLB4367]|uniref:CvpA family protein n=1 Tax=Paenibacillus sp. MBLB4367 TaxID=3384767 RepID=UPI0039082C59